ncbi:dephospho-CoA kinase [uncultured Alsobacter sp.]|uniref:dephospho-CoA kinase n=1 Tax=uncultured Alsobacter sp. TaxID=1748258 RepID=UPI0025F76EBB|nr:dephospho-CoA kinase [uncultured Alsobacter sp.]
MSFILGLTGSIGMGKSATAGMFRELGIPVHDADAAVHALYAGAAAPLIEAAFPGTVRDGVVDRPALSARVLRDEEAMRRLEAIVHPLVTAHKAAFLEHWSARPLVVLDVPLLFETGGERRCDAVVVVSAEAAVQRSRVLARPGMTPERFEAILARQVPDSVKRQRAHAVIDTGRGFDAARRQVLDLVRCLAGRPGKVDGSKG